jgi:wyosine [tRNA(Phe)-imidazoG37] synthetase (radical SAM superfamily)
MQEQGYRYLFGPVRSRRMGWSLGIDLVPSKICTYDCPYCQIGRTQVRPLERREYVPTDAVLAELQHWLDAGGRADFITLAGSGEPTLHSRFGDILAAIGRCTASRRALLSNGSLFHLPEVRQAAGNADVVKGTLSAWDEVSFKAVHRPHPGLTFAQLLSGLSAMRAEFIGEFWIEVFLVRGVNDSPEAVAQIAARVKAMRPDRVHLNTAVRPPADADVGPVGGDRLDELATLFTPRAETVATRPHAREGALSDGGGAANRDARILGMLRRHPCTSADVAALLQVSLQDAEQQLVRLVAAGQVRRETRGQGTYYTAA